MISIYPASQQECHACSARENCFRPVSGRGRLDAEILVIGETPDVHAQATGEAFEESSEDGKRLRWLAQQVGFDRDEVRVCYSVGCHIPLHPDGRVKPPSREEVLACRYWVAAEIARCRAAYAARYAGAGYPLAVITVGTRTMLSLLGPGKWSPEDYLGHWYSSPLFPELGDAIFGLPAFMTLRDGLRTPMIEADWKAALRKLWMGLGLMEKLVDPPESFALEDLPVCNGPYQQFFPCRCSGLLRRISIMRHAMRSQYEGARQGVRVQGLDDD